MTIFCISGKARHGKDTVARFMAEYMKAQDAKVLVTHYADLVKYVCKQFLGWNGKKDAKGRSLLQYVGTDVVKAQQPDYWIKFVTDMLTFFKNEWDYVIIPDARFPDEIEVPKQKGFDVCHIKVVRPEYETNLSLNQQKHSSETALDNVTPDYCITNSGDLAALKLAVDDMLDNRFGLLKLN